MIEVRQPLLFVVRGSFISVVRSALDNLYRIILNTVNKAICMVYAPAPISGQVAAQSLGLAEAFITVSVNVF